MGNDKAKSVPKARVKSRVLSLSQPQAISPAVERSVSGCKIATIESLYPAVMSRSPAVLFEIEKPV